MNRSGNRLRIMVTLYIEEVFPEVRTNKGGVVLRGSRYKDDLAQKQLSRLTGIPRPHISVMESGSRSIGKENTKKLAAALHCNYRFINLSLDYRPLSEIFC